MTLKIEILILYLGIINLISFGIMLIDKYKATKGKWRIPENTLLTLGAIGGFFGVICGMIIWKHKLSKLRFRALMPLAGLIYYGITCYVIFLK